MLNLIPTYHFFLLSPRIQKLARGPRHTPFALRRKFFGRFSQPNRKLDRTSSMPIRTLAQTPSALACGLDCTNTTPKRKLDDIRVAPKRKILRKPSAPERTLPCTLFARRRKLHRASSERPRKIFCTRPTPKEKYGKQPNCNLTLARPPAEHSSTSLLPRPAIRARIFSSAKGKRRYAPGSLL
jgi:hypothetical protein